MHELVQQGSANSKAVSAETDRQKLSRDSFWGSMDGLKS